MIKSMRLKNFKAFEDTGVLELRPITVLAGPNSGGKSSILQSLLLLKQTLDGSPEIDLNLDGRYLQFSGLNDFTFGKPSLYSSSLSYEFEIESFIPWRVVPRYFPAPAPQPLSDEGSLQSNIGFTFRHRQRGDKTTVVLDQFEIASSLQGIEGPNLRVKLTKGNYRAFMKGKGIRRLERFKNRKIKTVDLRHFYPYDLVYEGDEENDHIPHRTLDGIFSHPIHILTDDIRDNLKYLGPLRERPRRAYLHSGNPLTEVGDSGQYAAQILWLEKDNEIEYLPAIGQDYQRITLIEAVNDAFSRLGMLQPIDIKSEKSIMYQILFGVDGLKRNEAVTIADVGFGVSQLLPILVQGLRSAKSSFLLFEQPEIHLHPRLQANLADFFLTLAVQRQRVIVETHSDHFINRLRRKIAEDPTDELRTQVSILFVHPPQNGRGATIEPLQVDRFGVIENWPPDFLPESSDEAEAIFSAGLRKRLGDQDVPSSD